MSANIDILVDSNGTGLISGGSAPGASLPTLTRNDIYNFRLRVMNAQQGQAPVDIDTTGATLKLAIGTIDAEPTSGEFQLTLAGPVTSGNIPYNATTTQLFNAISGIAGGVNVQTYGTDGSSWLITAATNNTALSFGGVSYTLFPTSSVLINTRRNPDSNSKAQQTITLKRSPAVYADSFVPASTAGVVSLTKIQDGDSATNKNETYKLSIGSDAVAGSFVLAYGSNAATAIDIGSTAAQVQSAIASVTGIGSGNLAVSQLTNNQGYSLTFVNALGQRNVTTALTLDASGVYYAPYRVATVTMGTAELDALFIEDDNSTTIEPTLEIEITSSGNPKTLFQGPVTVRRDLISQGASVPSPQASYYTKAEADNKFVEDATSGTAGSIDAANFKFKDSAGTDSLDWGARKLFDGSTEYIRWDNGLGFFGNSAVTQPSGTNAISNVISTGLIANSATYGVLPGSIKTLTTTASIYFGQVLSNETNSVSVVVTGCSINDIVLIGIPSVVSNGLAFSGHVTTASGIEIDCINATNGNITPATATYRITVIGY